MNIFGQLKEKITRYLDVYIKLIKINFIGRTANLLSYFLFATIVIFISFCIILFFGFGLVEGLVAMGLPKVASFFIVVGFYLLLLLIVVALRGRITRSFAGDVVKLLTKDDEVQEEKEKNQG
jgi:hypothetical protein